MKKKYIISFILSLLIYQTYSYNFDSITNKFYQSIEFPFSLDDLSIKQILNQKESLYSNRKFYQEYFSQFVINHSLILGCDTSQIKQLPLFKLPLKEDSIIVLFTLRKELRQNDEISTVYAQIFDYFSGEFFGNYSTYHKDKLKLRTYEFFDENNIYEFNYNLNTNHDKSFTGFKKYYFFREGISGAVIVKHQYPNPKICDTCFDFSLINTYNYNYDTCRLFFKDQANIVNSPLIFDSTWVKAVEYSINKRKFMPNLPESDKVLYYFINCRLGKTEFYPIGRIKVPDNLDFFVYLIQSDCDGKKVWTINYQFYKGNSQYALDNIFIDFKENISEMTFEYIGDKKIECKLNDKIKVIDYSGFPW